MFFAWYLNIFKLGDKCFIMLCWFLPYNNSNQPLFSIYIPSLLTDSFEFIVLYLFFKEGPVRGVTGYTIPEMFLLPGSYFAWGSPAQDDTVHLHPDSHFQTAQKKTTSNGSWNQVFWFTIRLGKVRIKYKQMQMKSTLVSSHLWLEDQLCCIWKVTAQRSAVWTRRSNMPCELTWRHSWRL